MMRMKGICESIEIKKEMGSKGGMIMPIVSKVYCSTSEVDFVVRRRPNVVNGGGFAVVDSDQRVVFKVDGCGVVGKKEELILQDGEGNALLLMRRKGAILKAVSMKRQWKGFTTHDELLGCHKLVFTLKEPNSCFSITISIQSNKCCSSYGDFEIRGDFQEKRCSIVNSRGDVIAQIGVMKELEQVMRNRDLYHVRIKPGIDKVFVFGVIAVLDYIYD